MTFEYMLDLPGHKNSHCLSRFKRAGPFRINDDTDESPDRPFEDFAAMKSYEQPLIGDRGPKPVPRA